MEHIVTLETLANGAVLERFNIEVEKVLANIADPNTKAEFTREITVKIKIQPSAQRNHTAIAVETKSKQAPYSSVGTAAFIGKKGTRLVLVENNPAQLSLDENSTVSSGEFMGDKTGIVRGASWQI